MLTILVNYYESNDGIYNMTIIYTNVLYSLKMAENSHIMIREYYKLPIPIFLNYHPN